MDWLAHEDSWLAPYAMHSADSRGRQYPEEPHPFRTVYQRDRERIVHCTAFRRMLGKTQVLVGRINDHHRTRLTHSLEVAQISRTIARRLRLNEDLVEAIALSHDIGHPPFGHEGERALDECLRDHGGFDHNLYGLRRVDLLEERYPEFPGLNLSWELREAFAQHSRRRDRPELAEFFAVGSPLLEAQVVDAADSLAYDTHDTEDALGIGLIERAELEEVAMWRRQADLVRSRQPNLNPELFLRTVIRELIAWQVNDLLAETQRRLRECGAGSVADVRASAEPIVAFGPELQQLKAELEALLRQRVYRHPRVLRMAAKGRRLLQAVFHELARSPELLPAGHLRRWQQAPEQWQRCGKLFAVYVNHGEPRIERVVADYLAGMTDRYARQEYLRLFHPDGDC
jgi:dGTPase